MDFDRLDNPREECGVVGMYTLPERRLDVARIAFFSLWALQHRGQESAGIAVSDGRNHAVHRGMGLVSQIFKEEHLKKLQGHMGIGHNRYSTTGSSNINNAQPYQIETIHGQIAVGHNGNVTNAEALRRELLANGVGLVSSSDSEVLTQMLAQPIEGEGSKPDWVGRIARVLRKAEGAYSLVILTRDGVFALRDPLGMRPLALGQIFDEGETVGTVVASESSALGVVGAQFLREVRPGEVIRLDRDGFRTVYEAPNKDRSALCVFEHVYFARPDSIIGGKNVHAARKAMGAQLAKEHPVEADVVIGVPDSAIASAIGYAEVSGLQYTEGLLKNRYVGRTFIQPDQRMRRESVKMKYSPIRHNIEGKRVVMIDDSIVRGTTMGPLVRLLRQGGAKEVHVRIASPPVKHPCFMGIDLASHDQLIAHRMTVEAIAGHIGADSLGYLSVDGLRQCVGGDRKSYCGACFTGRYPCDVSTHLAAEGIKGRFERKAK